MRSSDEDDHTFFASYKWILKGLEHDLIEPSIIIAHNEQVYPMVEIEKKPPPGGQVHYLFKD